MNAVVAAAGRVARRLERVLGGAPHPRAVRRDGVPGSSPAARRRSHATRRKARRVHQRRTAPFIHAEELGVDLLWRPLRHGNLGVALAAAVTKRFAYRGNSSIIRPGCERRSQQQRAPGFSATRWAWCSPQPATRRTRSRRRAARIGSLCARQSAGRRRRRGRPDTRLLPAFAGQGRARPCRARQGHSNVPAPSLKHFLADERTRGGENVAVAVPPFRSTPPTPRRLRDRAAHFPIGSADRRRARVIDRTLAPSRRIRGSGRSSEALRPCSPALAPRRLRRAWRVI